MSKSGKTSKKASRGKAAKKSGQAAGVKTRAKKLAEKIDLDGRLDQLKAQLEQVWEEGEQKSEALWHQTAVASLHWISSHKTLTDDFKKSVKGTVLEKPVNSALKTIRAEAKAAKTAGGSTAAKKTTPAPKTSAGTTGRKKATTSRKKSGARSKPKGTAV